VPGRMPIGAALIVAAALLVASPAVARTTGRAANPNAGGSINAEIPKAASLTSSGAASIATCSWKDVKSPFSYGQLFGVTALSDSDAWSVGYATGGPLLNTAVIEHWNGKSWKVTDSPQPGTYRDFLEKVSAIASNDVWAVGGYQDKHGQGVRPQHTLVEHWDGTRWRIVASPNLKGSDNALFGLAAISTDDIWAVGTAVYQSGPSQALIEHWDGASWSIVPAPDPGTYTNVLASIAAVTPTDIWAVGTIADGRLGLTKTLAEHWDGSTWSVVPTPNIGSLGDFFGGVAAVSSRNVWAVGGFAYKAPDGSELTGTMSDRWNGTKWNVIVTPDPPGGDNQLHGVTALARDEVWAVGTSIGGPVILRWNGHGWVVIDAPGAHARWLWGVAALGPHDLWAVGSIALDFLIMRGC
jgi:hypothetical protein